MEGVVNELGLGILIMAISSGFVGLFVWVLNQISAW